MKARKAETPKSAGKKRKGAMGGKVLADGVVLQRPKNGPTNFTARQSMLAVRRVMKRVEGA